MSNGSSPDRSDTPLGFINTAVGRVAVCVTFLTSVFSAVKLLWGDSRLAIILLFFIGTAALWLLALHTFLKRKTTREVTIRAGVQIAKKYAYTNGRRYAALAAILVISALWAFVLLYKVRTPRGSVGLLTALTGERVNIGGFVMTAGGYPADRALVTLFLNDQAVETKDAPEGKFIFANVDITNVGPGGARIETKWRNLEARLTLNLSTDHLSNLTLTLPPGPPAFKVEYFVLEGPAIDFLVEGRMDARWEEKLGGQPTIVGNQVFSDLRDLMRRFSAPFLYETIEISNSRTRPKSAPVTDERLATRNKNRPFFLGGSKDNELSEPITKDQLSALLHPGQKWHLVITPDRVHYRSGVPSPPEYSFFFWRFATAADANMVLQKSHQIDASSKAAEFYAYITRDYLPADFFTFTLVPSEGDACSSSTLVGLHTRSLKLRIAILENISENPIRIGKFSIKENGLNRLRGRDEDVSMLNAKTIEQKVFFPAEFLKPKEKLVVPLELVLANDEEESRSAGPYRQQTSSEIIAALRQRGTIALPVGDGSLEVSTEALTNMASAPLENPKFDKEFVFGASIKIDSLDVDGINYPFRPLDTSVLAMNAGFIGASCPYVYTYASDRNLWINEGTILYGINAKWKETSDQKELMRFDGSIILSEKEPETSFIDQVYIRAINFDGSETMLLPAHDKLLRTDGRYLVLRRGEHRRIDFNMPRQMRAERFVLVARGYYVPFRN